MVFISIQNKNTRSDKNKCDAKLRELRTLQDKLDYLKKEKDIDLSHSNEEYLLKFADLLLANLEIFCDEGELGCFQTPVAIETKGEAINIRQHPIAQRFQSCVDEEIEKMFATGVIEECDDPQRWNSPIVVVDIGSFGQTCWTSKGQPF